MQGAHSPIVIVYFDLAIGGIQKKIVDIVNRLYHLTQDESRDVHILVKRGSDTFFVQQIRNNFVYIHYASHYKLFWFFIVKIILAHNASTILAFSPFPTIHAFVAKSLIFWKQIRLVIGEDIVTSEAFKRKDFSFFINGLISYVFSKANSVVVPAVSICHDLAKKYNIPESQIRYVPNWATSYAQHKNTHKSIDAIYVGRLAPEKRIQLMINIFSKIYIYNKLAKLIIVGSGINQAQLYNSIRQHKLSNISLLNQTHSAQRLLNSSKIAVFTSSSEGAPLFLIEAMTHHLPIVAMYYPGIEEMIIHKKNGFICNTEEEFIKYTKLLLRRESLRNRMGNIGAKIAANVYSNKNIDSFIHNL